MFTSRISLGNILNGISKTLNIANQVIPIYKKAKPLLSNTSNIIDKVKNISINKEIKQNDETKENKKTELFTNNPVFFH